MGKVTFNDYSHIQPRQVGDTGSGSHDDAAIGKAYEKRLGAASKLRKRVASLGTKISAALGRQRVESSAKQISGSLHAAAMKSALQKISEQRIARHSVSKAGPRPSAASGNGAGKAGALPFASTAATKSAGTFGSARGDAIALRDAITTGLSKALQSTRGAALIEKADVENFSQALSIALGLNDDDMRPDQFARLGAIKFEIETFLPADVRGKFDQLMQQTENKLMGG